MLLLVLKTHYITRQLKVTFINCVSSCIDAQDDEKIMLRKSIHTRVATGGMWIKFRKVMTENVVPVDHFTIHWDDDNIRSREPIISHTTFW